LMHDQVQRMIECRDCGNSGWWRALAST
jgi:hypothetical protein